ncbi:MAG TPA: hypothetical protein VNJ54_21150 [Plantibacter sp.]|uniref:hypothetical protein n=1 Tax=unclassified Plantibacter TaxID=2624265 RepID=UPI002CF7B38B|nr:hypothetical protein [Plantibacter sp.]
MTGERTQAGQGVRSNRSIGRVALAGTALVVGLVWSLTLSTPAAAQSQPVPTPSESATTPPPPDGPTITSPTSGSFIGSGSTTVSGTKDAGTGVQVKLGTGLEPVCILPQDDTTGWSCDVDLPDGGGLAITAVEVGGAQTLTAQVSVSALGPPTIAAGAPSNGGVRGTAYPGATVTVRADSGASCSFTADGSGSWFCVLGEPLASGSVEVTATQQASFTGGERSDPSSPVSLAIDRDAPVPPVLSSPVAGQAMPLTAGTYAGTGEEGATVTVFADSTSVCVATVVGGSWTCSGAGVPVGTHAVLAIQQDAAGNTSGASTPLSLVYGDATAAPATPSPSASPSPSNGAVPPPAPGTQPPGSQQPTPSQTDDPEPGAAPPGGGGLWSGSTPFSQTLASVIDGRGQPVWWIAALLALMAVALIAIPARLLASTLAPWRAVLAERRRSALTGRNRPRSEFDRAPSVPAPSRAAVGVITIAASAGIIIFAQPVSGQPAYLRLLIASLIAVLAINAAALLAQLLVARHEGLGAMRIVVRPSGLIATGFVTAASRLFALQPALLFALVAELRQAEPHGGSTETQPSAPVSRRSAGRLALARIAAAAALGALAWSVSALAGEPSGGVGALLVETVNLTAIAGIGSASIALLPIGPLGGRTVLDWSRPVWLASALVGFTLLFGLLGPTATIPGATDTLIGLLLGALAFAAVVSGAWAWVRHVRPLIDAH